jgi:hypothetical protein
MVEGWHLAPMGQNLSGRSKMHEQPGCQGQLTRITAHMSPSGPSLGVLSTPRRSAQDAPLGPVLHGNKVPPGSDGSVPEVARVPGVGVLRGQRR